MKSNQLRICMVSLYYHPFVGGAETRTAKQAHQLQALGHKVIIMTARHLKELPKTEIIDGIPIFRVGGSFTRNGRLRIGRLAHIPNDILMFLQLWRMRQHYDILHNMQTSPLSAAVMLIGKLTKKPYIISIPSTGPAKILGRNEARLMADTLEIQDNTILKVDYDDTNVGDTMNMSKTALGGSLILSFLQKSPAIYHILSQRTRGYMAANGFRADNVVHIPNGIDIDKYTPDPQRRPDLAQPERTILCVARLQYPKGIDILLHAWKRMLSEPDAWRAKIKPRLLIAGTGDLEGQLKWIASELGIEESVEFLGSRTDVIPLLQQSWGFVLPSRWEGMPNALLEAMGCGIPCIATRVSGSEDILQDGVNGLLVDPEQPAQLAVALHRLLADTPLALRLAEEGRATVVRDYQLAHIAHQFEDLYRKVLQQEDQTSPSIIEPALLGNVGGHEH
jgi:glycosyltransferase involved in cell wall biosynthesis